MVLKSIVVLTIVIFITTTITDFWVKCNTKKQLYNSVNIIPHRKTGLVLGTSKYLSNGTINHYYQYRIDATIALYQAGKIDFIIVSGDNSVQHYNEPQSMLEDLVAAGIPKEKIFMDYAGFRTLDSILRCREVFGENNITVISQPFHNERALFIANKKHIKAIAFNAQDVEKSEGLKTRIREKLARVKMVLDLTFGKKAKFYGSKIKVG